MTVRSLIVSLILLSMPFLLPGQCALLDSFYIPDESSENFILEVNGLSNDDLAHPNQGICRVNLHFEHDGIGDWEVFLTSPAGQTLRLVGPTGLFGSTNGSSWDVSFVPCGEAASPDLGFLPTWDSDQSWGSFSQFGGSYYPNDGCLEDFDNGPANGSWTLHIRDFNELDVGLLLGFSIEFCDETGMVTCLLCEAIGGRLVETNFSACQNDSALVFVPQVVFPDGQADTNYYDYTYLIVHNDIIIEEQKTVDLTNAPAGAYQICGLSYQKSDSTDVPQAEDMQSFSQFSDSLQSLNPPMCGELSENCLQVGIFPIPDTVIIDEMICQGDSYQIEGMTYTTPGTRILNAVSQNGCDSIIVLNLEVIEPLGELTGDSIFSCTDTIVDLFYDGESIEELDFIEWSNADGTFSASNTLSVQADRSGVYQVRVSKQGCVKTLTRTVNNSVDIPVITARGTRLTCSQRMRRITANSSITPATYRWTYNGSFFSDEQNPLVSIGGTYEVTVRDTFGCINRATVEVTMDTLSSESVAIGGSLRCSADSVQLDLRTRNGSTFIWSGPNGFTSMLEDPWVYDQGIYTAIVTLPNGCMDTVSAEVRNDVQSIEFTLVNDTIDCDNPFVVPEISSSILGTSFRWISPMGDTIYGSNPSLSESGFYAVRATTVDGCERDTIIELKIDTIKPVISLFGDLELTCSRQMLDLVVQTNPTDAMVTWVYPDRQRRVGDRITTRLGGQYQIIAERPNGCTSVREIEVLYGPDLPDPMTRLDSFDCSTDTAHLRVETTNNYSYEWSDRQRVLSNTRALFVADTGWYYLDVLDDNGCSAYYAYNVPINLDFPMGDITGPHSVTCEDSVIMLAPDYGVPVRSFTWMLDGGFYSRDSVVFVRSGGSYTVEVEFSSLCRDTLVRQIAMDTLKPVIRILPYDSLDCLTQLLDLAVEADTMYDYIWSLNGNTLVSDSIISISTPGVYVLQTASLSNDCVRRDTMVVKQDTVKPKIEIIGSEINCAAGKTEISVLSDLANVQYDWMGPGGFSSTLPNPLVNDTGVYRVVVTAPSGCFATDTTLLRGNFAVPFVQGVGGSLSCRDGTTIISAYSPTIGTTMSWFGAGGFVFHDSVATVADTGFYVVVAKGPNGCTSKDTVYVDDNPPFPVADVQLEEWTCRSTTVLAQAQSEDPNDIYRWVMASGQVLTSSSAQISELGILRLEVEGTNGCITIIDTIIPTDTISPQGFVSTDDIYICEHTQIRLDANVGDTLLDYGYYWFTDEGEILRDENRQSVLINALGVYSLELTNLRNGCKDTSVFLVEETPSNFRTAQIGVQDYNCLTGYNGSITIEAIQGGYGEVLVSIDGEPYVTRRFYDGLYPGEYEISLRDSFGCVLDTVVQISDEEHYRVYLPADTVIRLGETVTVQPRLSAFVDLDDLTVLWRSFASVDCDDCLDLIVQPLVNTNYCIRISNSTGCESEACVEVKVEEQNHVFVPQAFTPNGDGNNDLLVIGHSPDLKKIHQFVIYDRWGNLLYKQADFLPSDNISWDGTFQGRALDPQVFVYTIRYELINGTIYQKSGDISLIK